MDDVDIVLYDDGEIVLKPLSVVFQGKKVKGVEKKHFFFTDLKDMYRTTNLINIVLRIMKFKKKRILDGDKKSCMLVFGNLKDVYGSCKDIVWCLETRVFLIMGENVEYKLLWSYSILKSLCLSVYIV